jgi:uncharacterized protein (TIGR02646 family)
MHQMSRGQIPGCLAEGQETWTESWVSKVKNGCKATDWSWRSSVCFTEIRSDLLKATTDHCSFCDSQPVLTAEVDHFKSKMTYPFEAFSWPNLYACCGSCNKAKGSAEPGGAIRPDEAGYLFERYFLRDLDGTLSANPAATEEDQERATQTIQFLKLNRPDLKKSREIHKAGLIEPFRF